MNNISIKKLLENSQEYSDSFYSTSAWVVANRGNKKIRFIEINDGSTVENLQLTFKGEKFDFDILDQIHLGAAIKVQGIIKLTPQAKTASRTYCSGIWTLTRHRFRLSNSKTSN